VERGHVGVLAGISWGSADPELVENALEPHVQLPGGHLGYRAVDEARIRPQLTDLGVEDPLQLDAALVAWHRVALREWAFESWLAVESLQPLRLRLQAVQRRLGERGPAALARGHVEARQRAGRRGQPRAPRDAGARDRRRPGRAARSSNFLLDTARLRDAPLEDAEQAGARRASCAGSRSSTPVSAA
jgi:hypothetical protein